MGVGALKAEQKSKGSYETVEPLSEHKPCARTRLRHVSTVRNQSKCL
jgi:hypothetical protein